MKSLVIPLIHTRLLTGGDFTRNQNRFNGLPVLTRTVEVALGNR